jgi:hypothetical protein
VFFDDYPRFVETSTTGSDARRLGIRYLGIFKANQHIFPGARVLDIASHDGRWTLAANKTGAAHTTGIEFSPRLVQNARENFEHYEVDPDTYRFITGDVFDILKNPEAHQIDVDVVMCLGFIYHTLRHQELFQGIRRLNPKYFLIDSRVFLSEDPVVWLRSEETAEEGTGSDQSFDVDGQLVTGRPSVSALEMMLHAYGFNVVDRFDWPAFITKRFPKTSSVGSYKFGRRVTWLCELR